MEVEYRWGINFAVFDQYPAICEQEAQLSQRNRKTFRVIEYFVAQDHSRLFEITLLSRACISPY